MKFLKKFFQEYTPTSYLRGRHISEVIGKPRIFCSSRPLLAAYANFTVGNHVTIDVCLIPLWGQPFEFLQAKRQVLLFYEKNEHFLED